MAEVSRRDFLKLARDAVLGIGVLGTPLGRAGVRAVQGAQMQIEKGYGEGVHVGPIENWEDVFKGVDMSEFGEENLICIRFSWNMGRLCNDESEIPGMSSRIVFENTDRGPLIEKEIKEGKADPTLYQRALGLSRGLSWFSTVGLEGKGVPYLRNDLLNPSPGATTAVGGWCLLFPDGECNPDSLNPGDTVFLLNEGEDEVGREGEMFVYLSSSREVRSGERVSLIQHFKEGKVVTEWVRAEEIKTKFKMRENTKVRAITVEWVDPMQEDVWQRSYDGWESGNRYTSYTSLHWHLNLLGEITAAGACHTKDDPELGVLRGMIGLFFNAFAETMKYYDKPDENYFPFREKVAEWSVFADQVDALAAINPILSTPGFRQAAIFSEIVSGLTDIKGSWVFPTVHGGVDVCNLAQWANHYNYSVKDIVDHASEYEDKDTVLTVPDRDYSGYMMGDTILVAGSPTLGEPVVGVVTDVLVDHAPGLKILFYDWMGSGVPHELSISRGTNLREHADFRYADMVILRNKEVDKAARINMKLMKYRRYYADIPDEIKKLAPGMHPDYDAIPEFANLRKRLRKATNASEAGRIMAEIAALHGVQTMDEYVCMPYRPIRAWTSQDSCTTYSSSLLRAFGLEKEASHWFEAGKPSFNRGKERNSIKLYDWIRREGSDYGFIDVGGWSQDRIKRLAKKGYVFWGLTNGHSYVLTPMEFDGQIELILMQATEDHVASFPNAAYKLGREWRGSIWAHKIPTDTEWEDDRHGGEHGLTDV